MRIPWVASPLSGAQPFAAAGDIDGDACDGEFSGTIDARMKFNRTWGLVGEAKFGGESSQSLLGIRASF